MSLKLTDACEKHFGVTNLYAVLGINSKASDNEVKRAYYKMALKVHPDRVIVDGKNNADASKEATEKFQILGRIYKILSEKDSRSFYDESGDVGDENFEDDNKEADWDAYWKLIFKKITLVDIEKFKKEYQGSEEELKDLKKAYEDFKGDMSKIIENVFFASVEQEERYRKLINECIQKKELKSIANFTNENPKKKEARKRKADQEAVEAEAMMKEQGLGNGGASLEAVIQSRQEQRENALIDKLEAKYSKKSNKKSGKNEVADDDNEEQDLPQPRKARASKQSKKKTNEAPDDDADVEKAEPPKRATMARAAKKAVNYSGESEPEERPKRKKVIPPPKGRTGKKADVKLATITADSEEDISEEELPKNEPAKKAPAKKSGPINKSKGKAAAKDEDEDDVGGSDEDNDDVEDNQREEEEEEADVVVPEKKPKKGKAAKGTKAQKSVKKAKPKNGAGDVDSDNEADEMDQEEPPKKTKASNGVIKKTPAKKASAAKKTQESDDGEDSEDAMDKDDEIVAPQKAKVTKKKVEKQPRAMDNDDDEEEPPKKVKGSSKGAAKSNVKEPRAAKSKASGVKSTGKKRK